MRTLRLEVNQDNNPAHGHYSPRDVARPCCMGTERTGRLK